MILLIAPWWTTSSVALESHNLASSNVPGELWMLHWDPSPNYWEHRSTIRYSSDYGYTWTTVHDSGIEPCFHRINHILTISLPHDSGSSLLLTPDNFVTDTVWSPILGVSHEWLPDTSAWIAYSSQRGYSFDSLRTWQSSRWRGQDENHHFYSIEQYTCLGWSPGDMASLGSAYDSTAFYFSTSYADTFVVRGTLNLNGEGIYSSAIARGYAPGEVYYMDFDTDHLRTNVSLDTMMTWEGWRPLPDMQHYYGCFVEAERGWSPGEMFLMLYEYWNPDVPRIALWRTSDFGNTWTMVYSTIDDVSVVERPVELPSGEIHIWPNPGNGVFKVSVPTSTVLIRLFNCLGREVLSLHHRRENTVELIDLSRFSSGIYFLQTIDTQQGTSARKIVYLP